MARGAELAIRVNGAELMGSRTHASEERMAVLAKERLAEVPRPRVLIGGLGLGYTLRAALDAFLARRRSSWPSSSPGRHLDARPARAPRRPPARRSAHGDRGGDAAAILRDSPGVPRALDRHRQQPDHAGARVELQPLLHAGDGVGAGGAGAGRRARRGRQAPTRASPSACAEQASASRSCAPRRSARGEGADTRSSSERPAARRRGRSWIETLPRARETRKPRRRTGRVGAAHRRGEVVKQPRRARAGIYLSVRLLASLPTQGPYS